MPLVAPTPRRERILVFAPDKVGKTSCWLTVASYTEVDFWVADGDMAYWQNVEEFPNIDHGRMHITDSLSSWTDYVQWAEDFLENAKPDDWGVIDRVDSLREAALSYWIEEVHGQEGAAWFLSRAVDLEEENKKRREANRGEKGIQTEIDWMTINNFYYAFLNRLNTRAKGQHLFMASSAKQIITEGGWAEKDKRILTKFGDLKMKPQGGSGLPAIPGTILYLSQWGNDRRIRTIGDRGRERKYKLSDVTFNDFVTSYLIPVAKWKVV